MYRNEQNKGKLECVIDKSWECHRLCMLCACMSYCLCAERQESERERETDGGGGADYLRQDRCVHTAL